MKIRIFRAFPDPYRQSMTIYADQLLKGLQGLLKDGESAKDFIPAPVFLTPPLRYFSQYLHYPAAAALAQGSVNHITDHVYSHLIHTLSPKKTVITFHDAIWLKYRDAQKKPYLTLTQKLNLSGLAKAAAIICDSEASKNALLEYVAKPAGKISVIFPGLDPIFSNPPKRISRAKLNLEESAVYLLHVGHTASYKNIEGVLHTFARLVKNVKNIKLIKVGTSLTQEQTRLAKELGVGDRIIFKSGLSKTQLVQIYQASDFLLFPSFDEGFGFPALEAMASGLPVIASDRGSLPEVIANGGILKKPADHEGLAATISELIRDPKLKAGLQEQGRRRAADFSWEETARKVLEVYRAL